MGGQRARPARRQKGYVETSVWGMVLENRPWALREPTRQFLRQCASGLFVPYYVVNLVM
jgi:hypothetical protein